MDKIRQLVLEKLGSRGLARLPDDVIEALVSGARIAGTTATREHVERLNWRQIVTAFTQGIERRQNLEQSAGGTGGERSEGGSAPLKTKRVKRFVRRAESARHSCVESKSGTTPGTQPPGSAEEFPGRDQLEATS